MVWVWFDLGVVGGTADVGGEHHVREGGERVVGGKVLSDEVVETRRAHLPRSERLDEGVAVVELGTSGVEEDDAVAHG